MRHRVNSKQAVATLVRAGIMAADTYSDLVVAAGRMYRSDWWEAVDPHCISSYGFRGTRLIGRESWELTNACAGEINAK